MLVPFWNCFTHLKISCSEQREACLRTSGECSSESNRDSTVVVRGDETFVAKLLKQFFSDHTL